VNLAVLVQSKVQVLKSQDGFQYDTIQ